MKDKLEFGSLIAAIIGVAIANFIAESLPHILGLPFVIGFIAYFSLKNVKDRSTAYRLATSIQIGIISFTAMIILSKGYPVYDLYIALLFMIWFMLVPDVLSSFVVMIYYVVLIFQTFYTLQSGVSFQAVMISYTLIVFRVLVIFNVLLHVIKILNSEEQLKDYRVIKKIKFLFLKRVKNTVSLSFLTSALIFTSMNFDGFFRDSKKDDPELVIVLLILFIFSFIIYKTLAKGIQISHEGVKRLSYVLFFIGFICGIFYFQYCVDNFGLTEEFSMLLISSLIFAWCFSLFSITISKTIQWVMEGFKNE